MSTYKAINQYEYYKNILLHEDGKLAIRDEDLILSLDDFKSIVLSGNDNLINSILNVVQGIDNQQLVLSDINDTLLSILAKDYIINNNTTSNNVTNEYITNNYNTNNYTTNNITKEFNIGELKPPILKNSNKRINTNCDYLYSCKSTDEDKLKEYGKYIQIYRDNKNKLIVKEENCKVKHNNWRKNNIPNYYNWERKRRIALGETQKGLC